jgi:hypothetical protein
LFNTFLNASSNQGIITAGVGYNVIASTIGGVVSGAVSGFFNKVLQKYVKNLDFNFDVNSSMTRVNNAELQDNVERLQAAAKSNLVYTLLNGRLIITAGFNLDYNNPYVNLGRANNVLITPDFTAEWILSRDGQDECGHGGTADTHRGTAQLPQRCRKLFRPVFKNDARRQKMITARRCAGSNGSSCIEKEKDISGYSCPPLLMILCPSLSRLVVRYFSLWGLAFISTGTVSTISSP